MSDFRKRILEPLLIPLAAFVFVGSIAWGLSRILLVTTANGAAVVGLVAALMVLIVSAAFASRGFHFPEKAASLIAFVAIVAGGSVLAATMGIRPIEHHAPEPSAVVTAVNAISFEQKTITVEEAPEVVVRFTNNDPAAPHNWGVQAEAKFGASPPLVEPGAAINFGESTDYTLEEFEAGAYYFFCFVHPNMTGELVVGGEGGEGPAPEPAEPTTPPAATSSPTATASPSAPANPAGSVTIVAKDIAFDQKALTLTAATSIKVTFDNQDPDIPHNFAIYSKDLTEKIFDSEIFPGVETREGTFTAPAAGEYTFRCDVHPQMTGPVTFT